MKKYIIFLFFLFNLTVQWHDGALDIGAGSKALAQYGEEYSELDPPRWGAGGIQLPGNDEDPGGGYDPGYIQPPNIGDIPGVDPINPGDTEIKPPGDNGGVLIIVKEEEEDEKDKRDPLPEKERPVVDWGGDSEIKDDDDRWETEPTVGEEDGGGNPPPKTDPNKKPETKKPGIRDDCDESTQKNNEEWAKIRETMDPDLMPELETLKRRVRTSTKEQAIAIDQRDGKYLISARGEGEEGDNHVDIKINNTTVYTVHTHTKTSNKNALAKGLSGLTGPSVKDIYTILMANKELIPNNGKLKGDVIFAYDRTEYLIAIDNPELAKKYFEKNGKKWIPDPEDEYFLDNKMYKEHMEIWSTLENDGYSYNDAYDYALVFMLDKYKTGIKISKKESNDRAKYSELKTDMEEKKVDNEKVKEYTPKKCPD